MMELSYRPTLDPEEIERRLDRLLVPDAIEDADLTRRIDRLALAFRTYLACYPLPVWAPGLVLDNEMRGLTEALLPISAVRGVFDLLFARGCRFPPLLSWTYLHSCACWLDLCQKLPQLCRTVDPILLLRALALNGSLRRRFLFSLFLPQHYGGGFDRYPLQSAWLDGWLPAQHGRLQGRMRALDSACGSGEGTYALAGQLATAGFGAVGCAVHGSTLEPFELFAAAHAFFPHDRQSERVYRHRVTPLVDRAQVPDMKFYLDEVGTDSKRERYDLILCNGLLGGPLLHEEGEIAGAIRALASRLAPGGLLLAADRFHAGWRQRVPAASLIAAMRAEGLVPLEVPEGIAGEKTG